MSKRLMLRLALAIAALSATMLLQGCGDDDFSYSFVWVSGGATASSGASIQMSSVGPVW